MKILLTGAGGFVGRAMRRSLCSAGHDCVSVTRKVEALPGGDSTHAVGDISSHTDWRSLLSGVDVVLHLAGRAHVLHEPGGNARELFDAVNVGGTVNLAQQAVSAGVKRFVYVSSIGVHGASTHEVPFNELSPLKPYSPYTASKRRAEQELQALASPSPMEWVIVRPPLIYAADAPGNFQQLLRLVARSVPLPFSGVKNLRSMIALENLVDFLGLCCVHREAANQAFVVCDSHDVSTPEIIESLCVGMKSKTRLFWLPERMISAGATLVGRQHTYMQLFGSLRVDARKAAEHLGWQPVSATPDALIEAGRLFMETAH